eukprot:354601-Chlamydomonas_euryale.AAC.5
MQLLAMPGNTDTSKLGLRPASPTVTLEMKKRLVDWEHDVLYEEHLPGLPGITRHDGRPRQTAGNARGADRPRLRAGDQSGFTIGRRGAGWLSCHSRPDLTLRRGAT